MKVLKNKFSLVCMALTLLAAQNALAASSQKMDLACIHETETSSTGMEILRVIVLKNTSPVVVKVSSRSNKKAKLSEFAVVLKLDSNQKNEFYVLPKGKYKVAAVDSWGNYIFRDSFRKAQYTCSLNKKNSLQ